MANWKYNIEGLSEDMWTPYKHLYKIIQQSLTNPNNVTISDLEINLKKYKQVFANLLKNPPKNEANRKKLLAGISEGTSGYSYNRNVVISKDLIDESIIISDMYDLEEYTALELLCTAQKQMSLHPVLPRGLIAILLYYDGRKAVAYSLRDLFQATCGLCWATELPKEIIHLISTFTQSLIDDFNIIDKIIDILQNLDASEETILLAKNRALGPKKHQNQVGEMFEDIRLALATCVFNWSAQRGLVKSTVIKLVKCLSKYKATEASGSIDNVTFTLLIALLYSYDTSGLQRHEDNNSFIQKMPLMSEPDFLQNVYETLVADYIWEQKNGLDSIIKFSFGLSMARLRQAPPSLQNSISRFIERDEYLIDESLSHNIFEFLYHHILEKSIIYESEFFYRRIHLLFTDFIELMHSKLTELRGKADETAKTIMSFNREGLEPPPNLDHNFEMLMLCIGKFYKDNRAGLSLCTEFWGSADTSSTNFRSTARSVSLFKFLRLAGELLPTTLFVSYLKMIAGLTSCERSARNAFNLLKQSSQLSGSTTLSWEHFFGSLTRYYTELRQNQCPGSDTIYKSKSFNRSINPQEIEGLYAVLEIIESVAKYDEIARISICEHPNWAPLHVLLGLLGCGVPLNLKAKILETLSALAKSKESALQLWNNIEASQIITTIPNTNLYSVCSIEVEIEQTECRLEQYPLSKGILDLVYSLITTIIPKHLGGGLRKPGLDPYLTFIIKGIFLKFCNRTYKNSIEKWEIGEKCLKILYHLLNIYDVTLQDFDENNDQNASPGFHIMLQLHTKSDMLRMILLIIDDARLALDDYKKFPGKVTLEQCALLCLRILESGLEKQDVFFEAHSISNSSVLLSGLNKILLDVNPRSKKPDHIFNTTKFITYSSWLPYHALVSVKILNMISRQPNISTQILDMFTQNNNVEKEIKQGFVECLENDLSLVGIQSTNDDIHDSNDDVKIDLQIKEAIIDLLHNCLQQPAPNITLFLLGFDFHKEMHLHQRQVQFDSPNNCTKSLVTLLDNHLQIMKTTNSYDMDIEKITECAYALLFSLCANIKTSEIILRYLRSYNDFLYRHLSELPFKNTKCSYVLHQMSYLLKCVAIELKITAINCQTSRLQHFCDLLLGTSRMYKRNEDIPNELSHYYAHTSNVMFDMSLDNKPNEKIFDILICRLLNELSFDTTNQEIPKFEFFDNSIMDKLLAECEVIIKRSLKLVNIKKLHQILNEELQAVQSTIASGQRSVILKEIESMLLCAVKVNNNRSKSFASIKFLEAWSQVTEILFSCIPDVVVSNGVKRDLILEILQKILSKGITVETNLEMAILASGTVLILLVNLRNCYNQSYELDLDIKGNVTSAAMTSKNHISKSASSKSNSLSLKLITKNILEWIIVNGLKSQKLRINLYAALLNCLRIVKKNFVTESLNRKYERFVFRLDKSMGRNVDKCTGSSEVHSEIVASIGDELVDIICNDCITGHDICKMTALSCVDLFLNTDNVFYFVNFITNRGYLSHISNSLIESDEDLCRVLVNISENLKSLYIYESKLAVLIRLANSHVGAEILLVEGVLSALGRMKVFDTRPDIYIKENNTCNVNNEFIPSLDMRFQQILFPALNLCNCILSTLGTENHSAISQIAFFIYAHCDMIEMALRSASPDVNANALRELTAITGLISRITNQEILRVNDPQIYNTMNFYRIESLMLSTLNRFVTNDNIFSKIVTSNNTLRESMDVHSNTCMKYYLEILANLSLFCRNAIANHTADHKTNRILFYPNINESLHSTEYSRNNTQRTQSLALILNLLKKSVEYFDFELSLAESLLRQRSSLTNINFDIIAKKNYMDITKLHHEKGYEISICAFIVEQCLYLLWSHLDFYARRAFEMVNGNSDSVTNKSYISEGFQDFAISLDDVVAIKKTFITVFNETFCKKLLLISESSGANEQFNEALLRRIKSLIQLIPV